MAGRATKWTDAKLRALALGVTSDERRVLVARGLYLHLRRRADGVARHWQYRAQVGGKRRWLSLGEYPSLTLAQATAEALKHGAVRDAAKRGEADHPAIAARAARQAQLAQPTVAEAFAEWIADKRLGSARKRGQPVRARTIAILCENFEADIRGGIGDAKMARLSSTQIRECIDRPRRRGAPGAAAHVYRTLRGLISFSIRRGYVSGADPMQGIENPRPYRPQVPIAATDKQLIVFLQQLDRSKLWPCTRLAIQLQLLTGARPSEVRLATWREFDLSKRQWLIPAERFKSDRPMRVHLSEAALEVLQAAQRMRSSAGKARSSEDFVFPGANGSAMEKMAVARALSRIAERDLQGETVRLRPHDLRRTFRTVLSRIGVAPHIGELCLGHVERETMRRVYDGHDYFAECAEAWERAGHHLRALRCGSADVVSLDEVRKVRSVA